MTSNSRVLGFTPTLRPSLFLLAIGIASVGQVASAASVKTPQVSPAAATGTVSREAALADNYFAGRSAPRDLKMAAYWYEKAAEHGDPRAENQIGYFYQAGIGVPQDPVRAFHWYQLSAASGLINAKVNLAVAYLWGTGVTQDKSLAVQLLHEAVKKGSGTAAAYLGDLYYLGIAVDRDRAAAEHWYEIGVKLHDPVAANDLGMLYSSISDHPHDFAKAARLFRESAATGYVRGLASLGLLLVRHPELAKSADEARNALETAASSGAWNASLVLGILARDGNGIPVDLAAAYYRFQIAVLQGGEKARHLLENELTRLSAKLPAEQSQELASEANSWFHQHAATLEFIHTDGTDPSQIADWGRAIEGDGSQGGHLIPYPPA